MKRNSKDIERFHDRYNRLSSDERTQKETYELVEKGEKHKKGKRFYKNYQSFRKSRAYLLKKGKLKGKLKSH